MERDLHFLERTVERLDRPDVEFATRLWHEPQTVRMLLAHLRVPEGDQRVALGMGIVHKPRKQSCLWKLQHFAPPEWALDRIGRANHIFRGSRGLFRGCVRRAGLLGLSEREVGVKSRAFDAGGPLAVRCEVRRQRAARAREVEVVVLDRRATPRAGGPLVPHTYTATISRLLDGRYRATVEGFPFFSVEGATIDEVKSRTLPDLSDLIYELQREHDPVITPEGVEFIEPTGEHGCR